MAREVSQESGLEMEEAVLTGLLTFPASDGQDDWYAIVYLVTGFRGTTRAGPEADISWIPTVDLPDLPLWPGDRVFLPWLDQPGFFSATFRYERGEFVGHEVAFYPG